MKGGGHIIRASFGSICETRHVLFRHADADGFQSRWLEVIQVFKGFRQAALS